MPGSISLRQAERKYGIPNGTLSDWVAAGLIRVVRHPETRGQAMLVMEQDIADAAAHYTPGPGRGKRKKLAERIAAA